MNKQAYPGGYKARLDCKPKGVNPFTHVTSIQSNNFRLWQDGYDHADRLLALVQGHTGWKDAYAIQWLRNQKGNPYDAVARIVASNKISN